MKFRSCLWDLNPADRWLRHLARKFSELVLSAGINSKRKPPVIMCSTVQSAHVTLPFGPFSPVAALRSYRFVLKCNGFNNLPNFCDCRKLEIPIMPYQCIELTDARFDIL